MPKSDANDVVIRTQRQSAAHQQIIDRLKMLRTLWIVANNLVLPTSGYSDEFFFAVGDILEGKTAGELVLRTISKEAFLKELKNA